MGRVTLYMSVSIDGFIADEQDNTEWVSKESWQSYLDFVGSCDVVLVGRKTFELMQPDEFLKETHYIVVTNNQSYNSKGFDKLALRTKADLPVAIRIGAIGGSSLNSSLLGLGLVDELILDVEPIILGHGKRLFAGTQQVAKLDLVSSARLGTHTIQNRYIVSN